ncbi:hypothetical protein BH24CHL4_BH24CHL4_25740 [soil metagenome]
MSKPPRLHQPGCASREDAVQNIREAIELYVEGLEEDHRPIPVDTLEAFFVAV